MNHGSVRLKACAKINLSLSVMGLRPDGYHEMDTVMQSVDLCDEIIIEKSHSINVICEGIGAEENIAARAARVFFAAGGIDGGAKVTINKNIPAAAGLGGGSADAAAVLCGLNSLYGADMPYEKLVEIAAGLGADVPFLINGGTARARGIGEKLTPLNGIYSYAIIIAKGDKKGSTAEMFRRLDAVGNYLRPNIESTVSALNGGNIDALLCSLDNSFSCLWENSGVRNCLADSGADRVSLSGSGPSWFAIYKSVSAAKVALTKLKALGTECYLCLPQNKSVFFE